MFNASDSGVALSWAAFRLKRVLPGKRLLTFIFRAWNAKFVLKYYFKVSLKRKCRFMNSHYQLLI